MAFNGTYGTKKPALITYRDVDIFYLYRPTRSTDSSDFNGVFKKLDSTMLSNTSFVGDTNGGNLPGMYNLRLPVDKFGMPGFYTIYIKPKEIEASILDVSVLAAYSDVRGIVLNTNTIVTDDTSIFNNGGLVGYRVEYYDNNNEQLDMFRIITSNNRCEPVAQNFNNAYTKGIKYILNDTSNLIFCTVTPSAAMSFNSSALPSIGTSGQKIKLVNTKFNPIMLEVEMTKYDISDVATMLEGDQIRNLDKGIITTFNSDGEIYHQAEYGNIIDTANGIATDYKFKRDYTNIINSEKDKMEDIKGRV